MAWTERQRRMLAEMGLQVWSPASAVEDAPGDAWDEAGEALGDAPGGDAAVAGQPREQADALAPAMETHAATGERTAARHRPMPGRTSGDDIAPLAPAGVAAMDWPALREAVAACRACRLCEGRRNTVFGVGNERAHLMVVGEAPGEQEDRQGEPFVGAAGQLLDRMLAAIGLARTPGTPERQVFIANTLKCRPPGNRNPEPDEMVKCEPFLQRQLALVQPRVILAMGRFAVQALLRSTEPIGRLRGRVHAYEGVPLVVTYHPAYLLRNLPDKAKAWDDLCLAVSVLEKAGRAAG
jgi:DNA polymerase